MLSHQSAVVAIVVGGGGVGVTAEDEGGGCTVAVLVGGAVEVDVVALAQEASTRDSRTRIHIVTQITLLFTLIPSPFSYFVLIAVIAFS